VSGDARWIDAARIVGGGATNRAAHRCRVEVSFRRTRGRDSTHSEIGVATE